MRPFPFLQNESHLCPDACLLLPFSLFARIPELQNLVTDKTPKSAPKASDAEIDEKDVEILMAQASCDREKAVRVLKEANGDLINASACSLLFLSFSFCADG